MPPPPTAAKLYFCTKCTHTDTHPKIQLSSLNCFHGNGIWTCIRTFSFFSLSVCRSTILQAACGNSARPELLLCLTNETYIQMFLSKWNLSTQTNQGASYLAHQWNVNSIRVDIVFYYSPGQSSGPFICTFKVFTLSFVNPVAWLGASSWAIAS